jgi:hypothetical protein
VWLAGFTSCGSNTARIIVASPEQISVRDAVKLVQEVVASSNSSMNAYAPSFTPLESEIHANMNFASIHAYKPRYQLRPVDEKTMANCHAITATSYMDTELNSVWERKEINGQQFLVRANDDDPTNVLNTALLASTSTDARVNADGFIMKASAGDFVVYFALEAGQDGVDNKPFLDVAQVKEVTGDTVKIELEDKGYKAEATLHAASIVCVVTGSAALDGTKSRADIIEFLKECYPQGYGSALNSISKSEL